MAHGREVLYRLTNAMEIIDSNIADARARRPDVHENQGNVAKFEIVEERFFHAKRHDCHAFDPVLQHAPY